MNFSKYRSGKSFLCNATGTCKIRKISWLLSFSLAFRVVTILYKPIWLSKFLEIIVQKILFFSLPTIFPAACFWTYAMTAIKFSVLINHLQCVLANTFTIKCIVLMSWKSWQIKDFWLCRPSRDSSYFFSVAKVVDNKLNQSIFTIQSRTNIDFDIRVSYSDW